MKIVLDTNVLLVSISSKSASHPIFISLIQGDYSVAVSTDILLEYEEKIQEHMGEAVAHNALKALIKSPFVEPTQISFFWQLISKDADDNKFVDCYLAANADYLVTDDKDFRILAKVDFPEVKVISKNDFLKMITK